MGKKSTKRKKKSPVKTGIRRSRTDKMLGGVCGGIAKQFGVDAIWVRLVMVLLALLDGIGIILYLVAWLLIPDEKESNESERSKADSLVVLGAVLILLGIFFLLRTFIKFEYVWPVALIALGIYFLTRKKE